VPEETAKHEVIREVAKENAETLATVASPGKLTGEKVWDKWKAGLENATVYTLRVLTVSPWSTFSARRKNQKKGRPMPASPMNASRNVD
jgi:hypothetical protein